MKNQSGKSLCLIQAIGLACALAAPLSNAGASAIDDNTVQRLKASLDYVAGLEAFALETTSTIEVVLRDDQKLQLITPPTHDPTAR